MLIYPLLRFIGRCLNALERKISTGVFPKLKHVGREVNFGRGVVIESPHCVWIGDRVTLGDYCWFSLPIENRERGSPALPLAPNLIIGDGTYIGRFGTIGCMKRIEIGRNVLISDRVFIGDTLHGFKRTDIPICDQYLVSPGPVVICDGAWLGIGVSILPNVTIGRNCVVGANSVVTSDVPDFCVVVGAPARVIKTLET
jgi:acetyltransferase-like isoleucine patch superfamily enzyme